MSQRGGEIRKTFDLGKYVIAKIKKGHMIFEMIADPDAAWKAKQILMEEEKKGKNLTQITLDQIIKHPDLGFADIFPTFDVFLNVKKAEVPTTEELQESFGTTDHQQIAAFFVKDGEFAWTKTQRDKWTEAKKKQIINILSRNCINPQTKKPHPPARIEKAMEEAHVSLDLVLSAEEQIDSVLRKISSVIPIRMEITQLAIKVPAIYAAKAYNTIDKFAQIKQSEWETDGSWVGIVSLPAGLQTEFLEKLNNLTHGKVQTKLIQS
jgi:ribosome maturation protein SDO1